MIKKEIVIYAVLMTFMLTGCGKAPERIVRGRSRGNKDENVRAVEKISGLGTVKTAAVLCGDGAVIAGLRLLDRSEGQNACDKTLEIIKAEFPDEEIYIVGADEQWAEDVIELSQYVEGGMDEDILEKRFEYLVEKKINEEDTKSDEMKM